MKRLPNSNFALIEEVIKDLKFNYNENNAVKTGIINNIWAEIVGNKILQFTKVYEISDDNILTILCSDSFVANELYLIKSKLIDDINEKGKKSGIEINEIKFNYKKWKEEANE